MTYRIQIEGMHCKNCAQSVTKALLGVDGTSKAEVSLDKKQVAVTSSANEAVLRAAIDEIGFEVTSVTCEP